MGENERMLEVLERIEKQGQRQAWIGIAQCVFSLAAAVCCAVLLVTVLRVLPQMEAVLGNLERTTQQLAAADLISMAENMDALVVTGQQSLEQTMEKINALDLETLNKAIEDLSKVIEPLARFFRAFN